MSKSFRETDERHKVKPGKHFFLLSSSHPLFDSRQQQGLPSVLAKVIKVGQPIGLQMSMDNDPPILNYPPPTTIFCSILKF